MQIVMEVVINAQYIGTNTEDELRLPGTRDRTDALRLLSDGRIAYANVVRRFTPIARFLPLVQTT